MVGAINLMAITLCPTWAAHEYLGANYGGMPWWAMGLALLVAAGTMMICSRIEGAVELSGLRSDRLSREIDALRAATPAPYDPASDDDGEDDYPDYPVA